MGVGFIGLGVMGQPMALNLTRAGTPLVVWNRSPGKSEALRAAGARVATSPDEVLEQACIVLTSITALTEAMHAAEASASRPTAKRGLCAPESSTWWP